MRHCICNASFHTHTHTHIKRQTDREREREREIGIMHTSIHARVYVCNTHHTLDFNICTLHPSARNLLTGQLFLHKTIIFAISWQQISNWFRRSREIWSCDRKKADIFRGSIHYFNARCFLLFFTVYRRLFVVFCCFPTIIFCSQVNKFPDKAARWYGIIYDVISGKDRYSSDIIGF